MLQPAFRLEQFNAALKPCVYAWRRNGDYLYVGMSRLGLARPCGRHHVIGVVERVLPDDVLDVWVFETSELAAFHESTLIREQRPTYNRIPPIENQPGLSGKRVALNCLVAPSTLEYIRETAAQRGISHGVLIDMAIADLVDFISETGANPVKGKSVGRVIDSAINHQKKADVATWRSERKPLLKSKEQK